MKAFVTGGTGFIGSHLVDTLIEESTYEEVKCLVRNNEKWLKDKSFTKISGDLHDLSTIRDALSDVDVIFHAAGVVKAPGWREFRRANVEATEHLLRLARKQGVGKVVVLSSLAAAGPSTDLGRPVTEQDPMRPVSMYGRSKKEMEEMIHRTVGSESSVTILRPSAVYGPREDQIFSFFQMADKRICPIIGDGEHPEISMVYVHDLVRAMIQAADQRKEGVSTYLISDGTPHSWNRIREITLSVLGKKAIPIYIKPTLVKKIAGIIERTASFFGVYPVINREKANEMVLEWTCSIDRARNELDYRPRYSLAEGISRTIHWYKMHHWL